MSHFTTLETRITDLACLEETLEAMGLSCRRGSETVKVRGWQGNLTDADLVVATGTKYDIGVRRTAGGSHELIADWQMVEPALEQPSAEEFIREVTRRYTHAKVMKEIRARGFEVTGEETNEEDRTIKLRVRRWVP